VTLVPIFSNRFKGRVQPPGSAPPPPATVGAQLLWGNNDVGSSTTTRYLSPGFNNSLAEVAPTQIRASRAGTMRNMRVRQNIVSGNGSAIVYVFRVNGVVTALTVSMASTASDGSDLASSVVVAAGDLLDIEVTKAVSVGSSPSNITATFEFA